MHLKYFFCINLLDYKCDPGVLVCKINNLYCFLTPFGKENGLGCFHKTEFKGDYFNKSNL